MKVCKICEIKVGSNSRTLLCRKHRVKKWILEHREQSNAIKRNYVKKNPDNRYSSLVKYKNENRERVNAWAVLEYHVKNGDIIKPEECEVCGKEPPLHAHHPDIAKPLEVKWVCPACHKAEHGYQVNFNYA